VVPVSSCDVAEAAKLLENIFRSVNIALVNELKVVFDRMDIDVWEVIEAAKTKPFGFMTFYPGPGMGGHCIPVDPFYLTWKAREYELSTKFIELAGEVNTAMPQFVLEKVRLALNSRQTSIKGARILVLGVAYKKDVDDVRESPALKLIEELGRLGARVSYHDPYVPSLRGRRLKSSALNEKLVRSSDLVMLITDHSGVDYGLVRANARLIVDTRGKWRADQKRIFGA